VFTSPRFGESVLSGETPADNGSWVQGWDLDRWLCQLPEHAERPGGPWNWPAADHLSPAAALPRAPVGPPIALVISAPRRDPRPLQPLPGEHLEKVAVLGLWVASRRFSDRAWATFRPFAASSVGAGSLAERAWWPQVTLAVLGDAATVRCYGVCV